MDLSTQVTEMIGAGCPALWINSDEHEDAVRSIVAANSCVVDGEERQPWQLFTWDTNSGLRIPGQAVEKDDLQDNSCKAALNTMCAVAQDAVSSDQNCSIVLVIRNAHNHVGKNVDLIQSICEQVVDVCVIALSFDGLPIPRELQSLFRVINHDLPDRDERKALIIQSCDDAGVGEDHELYPADDVLEDVVDATGGNTRLDILTDCGICFHRLGRLDLRTLFELKADNLVSSTALKLMDTTKRFDDLGGLTGLKEDSLRRVPLMKAIRNGNLPVADREAIPCGCMLVSIPGGGKTHWSNALANEVGLPGLKLDVTSLLGEYVGTSEGNMRQALGRIKQMAPCIVFVDEIEKVMPKPSGGSGGKDGGSAVRSGLTSMFLDAMSNDDMKGVYWIFAANSAEDIHPAMLRSERLDDHYFLDLPSRAAKDEIWKIYLELFDLRPEQYGEQPNDAQWTGSEIRACCRKSRMDKKPLKETAKRMKLEAVRSADDLAAARKWAVSSAIDADTGEEYTGPAKPATKEGATSKQVRRAVKRKTNEDV